MGCRSRISWADEWEKLLWGSSSASHWQHTRSGLAEEETAQIPQLLPRLQWIPGASRDRESCPKPPSEDPGGVRRLLHLRILLLLGSGVRPRVNWEETRMLNITKFIYLFTYSSWQFLGQPAGYSKCRGCLPDCWVRPHELEASASLEGRLSLSFLPWERAKSLANRRTRIGCLSSSCTDLRYYFWCFTENILQQQCLVVTQSSLGYKSGYSFTAVICTKLYKAICCPSVFNRKLIFITGQWLIPDQRASAALVIWIVKTKWGVLMGSMVTISLCLLCNDHFLWG